MPKAKHSRRGVSIGLVLSLVSLVLGIGCIGYALFNINAESLAVSAAYRDIPSVEATSPVTPAVSSAESTSPAPLYSRYPAKGEVIGSLSIPALKQKFPLVEGTGDDDLKRGVGHYSQSVLPGEQDNCVLSGHRDTVFTGLGELKTGDLLVTQTTAGVFTYKIRLIRIVEKDDTTVIVPTDHAVLTVSTCYPFHYVGPAPKRYVLIADLVQND